MTRPFLITEERPASDDATLVVRVPAGINRKRKLLAVYARQLRFPCYFGWNWDAFEDALRDLSWLHGVQRVIISHRDVPFGEAPEQQEIYVSILADRVEFAAEHSLPVEVRFPHEVDSYK